MSSVDSSSELKKVLVDSKEVRAKVKELATRVSKDYKNKELILVGILKGAFMFLSDLVKEMKIPVQIDFIAVSSYGMATKSSGVVRIVKDLDLNIQGRHVLLIEDIIDTGLTLSYILEIFKLRNPASLEVCVLLQKEKKKKADIPIKYMGFNIPDEFVVGYGLDCEECFRHLPSIYAISTKSQD